MARLLQLSDLHVMERDALASGVLDTRALLRDGIDWLLARLEAIGPIDAVLVTGDISHNGSDESYICAREELSRLDLPLLVIPGNHDRRDALRQAFAEQPEMPDAGPIDWYCDVAGTRVIGLDTLVEGQGGGRLAASSLVLLSRALGDAVGRPVIVALHHPPIHTGIRFMDAIGLENPDELASILSSCDKGLDLQLVAGHVHGVHVGRLGDYPVLTAPSMCSTFALDRREEAPVGFFTAPRGCAVIDTGPDRLWTAITFDPAEGPLPF